MAKAAKQIKSSKNEVTARRKEAKLKPVSLDNIPTEAEFDLLVMEYLQRQKDSTDTWNYAVQNLMPRIQAYVKAHGKHDEKKTDRPEDAILYHNGIKWHNQGSRRRAGKEKVGIDYCKENGLNATQKITVLDWDKWEELCTKNKIPTEIAEQVNVYNVTYKLHHYDVSKNICPQCETKISKNDKFCKNCGHSLNKS